ncbi:MAG TPA: energy-coupling factor ABC transporter permease [Aggregatilineales bacterium]|nr:energy-coupling factor ABC transporter permease [Aggregatilineales bacterium]
MFFPFFAMHIPDGFLNIPVAAVGWALLIVLIAVALRQTRKQVGERQIPLMGILAACVFAAQMLNFPVAGGTSGHLLGGMLVAVLLGPWATVLVMTCAIGVQGLLFQDGGLTALGFNVFNMGIISGFVGYAVYTGVCKLMGQTPASQLAGAALGAWLGVVLSSVACSLELAASGTSQLSIALPAMVGVHMLIGVGEALITVAAVAFIRQTRPDLIDGSAKIASTGYGWIAAGLLIALALAFASPLANRNPDGLDRVAQDQGFAQKEQAPLITILPNYTVPVIQNETLTTIAAGVLGVLAVAGVAYGVARLAGRKTADPVAMAASKATDQP